jgi:phage tail-like protein
LQTPGASSRGRARAASRVARTAGLLLLVLPAVAQSPSLAGLRLLTDLGLGVTFRSCTGLGSQSEYVSYKVVGPDGEVTTRKIPGATSFADVSCTRTVSTDLALERWRQAVVSGNGFRTNARLTLLDDLGSVVAEWALASAWPATLTVSLDDSSHVATETVGLAVEGTTRLVVGAPRAVADAYATDAGTPLDVTAPGVLGNDSAPGAIHAVLVSPPAHGTLTLQGDGSFHFEPEAGFSGDDGFTYTAAGGGLESPPAPVTITVGPQNLPPVANPQALTTAACVPLPITLTARDPEGHALTYSVLGAPAHGTLSGTPPSVTYTPAANFSGDDSFLFVANDGVQNSAAALVSIAVAAAPAPGVTASGPTTFCAGGSVTLTADGGLAYLWSTGATTRAITVTQAGAYSVAVTSSLGCTATSEPVTVTVNTPAKPTISASGPTLFCPGGSVTLTASTAASYLWSTGATSRAITVATGGSYTVTATDANGCAAASDPLIVTVAPSGAGGCDADGDGVPDAVEAAAPHGGDGNFDGIPDSAQKNVASLPSASGPYFTLEATGACSGFVSVHAAPEGAGAIPPDAGFTHPFGLVGFRIPCAEGLSATVKIFFHGATAPPTAYRRYGPPSPVAVPGPGSSTWQTLPGVTFTPARDGIPPTATFTLTSGAPGDDTSGDAIIVNEGGAAQLDAAPAADIPALDPRALAALALLLALAGLHASRRAG